MQKDKIWFKKRKYGWGWTPVSWQAWFILLAYLVLLIFFAILLLSHANEELGIVYIVAFGLIFLSLTSFLLGISYRKGEPPSWQWGDKEDDKLKSDEKPNRRRVENQTKRKTVPSTKK